MLPPADSEKERAWSSAGTDLLLQILWRIDLRLSALEMDSEGRGSDSCEDMIDELNAIIEGDRQRNLPSAEPGPAGGKE